MTQAKRSSSRPAMATAFLGLLALALWLDNTYAQAGLIALVVLTLTTGFLHGALDAVIMLRQLRPTGRAAPWAFAYLLSVVVLALAFAPHSGAALVVLLLLSVWHFGEPFDANLNRCFDPNPASTDAAVGLAKLGSLGSQCKPGVVERVVTRMVVGGAPVLLPAITSARQLEASSNSWINLSDQWAWPAWQALAWVWLGLMGVWTVRFAWDHWLTARKTLAEVAALAALNLLLTPLMAFAFYFGLYHAPAHIRRVARASATGNIATSPLALLTLLTTLILGAALFAWRSADISALRISEAAFVEWLVVALLALTVPHMVLISYFAPWLSQQRAPTEPTSIP